jgi:hypothetical protein
MHFFEGTNTGVTTYIIDVSYFKMQGVVEKNKLPIYEKNSPLVTESEVLLACLQ